MAVKPTVKAMTADMPKLMNTIRANASPEYQNLVPEATTGDMSARGIGAVYQQYPALKNEFIDAINRIGIVIVTSRMYNNPWAPLKRGIMEYGETVEELFVNIATPHTYDPAVAEQTFARREIPDVRSAFHVLNYKRFYKTTVQEEELRQAFLSWSGVSDLIGRIIDSLYSGAEYDEFLAMKYLLALALVRGNMTPVSIPAVNDANMKAIVSTVKGNVNALPFMSTAYNEAGVLTKTDVNDIYIILNAKFEAVMDVEVLASAFNMDKADFIGRRILVDSFAVQDIPRLNQLFEEDPTYVEITAEQNAELDEIPAVVVSRDWFVVLDNLNKMTDFYNSDGLYWNYSYHVWKILSYSPFAEAMAFISGTPAVTAVTVSPSEVTAPVGQTVNFTAKVESTDFAASGVIWTSDNENVSITPKGVAQIRRGATGTATITATSRFNPEVSGTAVITVG